MEAASKLRENSERGITRPCTLNQNCAASCSFIPHKAAAMEERGRRSARAGVGALPPGPQGVLIQGSKDHSHNPDTALPSAGTHPIQTLAAWSDDEMGGCECERYMGTHVHACVYISTLAAWSDHEMGGWECERYRCTHVHACVYISLHQCTVQNCLETT